MEATFANADFYGPTLRGELCSRLLEQALTLPPPQTGSLELGPAASAWSEEEYAANEAARQLRVSLQTTYSSEAESAAETARVMLASPEFWSFLEAREVERRSDLISRSVGIKGLTPAENPNQTKPPDDMRPEDE